MSTIRAFLGTAGLTDVGYRFYTQATPAAARVAAGIVDEGGGWYSAAHVTIAGDHVRWDSLSNPDAAARENVTPAPVTSGGSSSGAASGSREVKFKTLLKRTVRICGLDYDTLPSELAESFATWLEARAREIWHIAQWPEICPTEQRGFAAFWDGGVNYLLDDVVRHDDGTTVRYFRALTDTPAAVTPGTNVAAGVWGQISDYDRSIPLLQEDETPIGEVLGAWRENPSKVRAPRRVGYWLAPDAVQFDLCAGPTVWLKFRKRTPVFTAAAYAAGTTYTPEDVFSLDATGDCYVPLAESTGVSPLAAPESFAAQRCPEALADYAARAARADFLDDDGQGDKAVQALALAKGWLNDRLADLAIHQQQTARYSVA